jgi:hypothetical protein
VSNVGKWQRGILTDTERSSFSDKQEGNRAMWKGKEGTGRERKKAGRASGRGLRSDFELSA